MPRTSSRRLATAACTLVVTAAAIAAPGTTGPADAHIEHPDHVVIVMMENKRYDAVIGDPKTPYISTLATTGANFTNAYAETHPSQPNYLALFSGSTQTATDNHCGYTFAGIPNLGRQLLDAGQSFTGYAEALPSTGWTGCASATYVRRHNPWVDFTNVPASSNRPLTSFPTDYQTLPTVSFVVPGLCHDMHDCPKSQADAWLRSTMDGYLTWSSTHNSVLILTFDEDNKTDRNHIPTVILGAHVAGRTHPERIDHYSILRTIEDWYGLAPLGMATQRLPITLS
jgi:phosphatidylinositol-3-phosphatase